ncbi:hypothetical protein GCM10023238_32370 [Streptomyces heliomycini]
MISTDNVFDGSRPDNPEDARSPRQRYGRAKLRRNGPCSTRGDAVCCGQLVYGTEKPADSRQMAHNFFAACAHPLRRASRAGAAGRSWTTPCLWTTSRGDGGPAGADAPLPAGPPPSGCGRTA